MADWIKASTPPETPDWVIGMTQDGTVYPVVYKNKMWSPLFRGGAVESMMHGRIIFWQDKPDGYKFAVCDHNHRYLKTPETAVCPICKQFGFIKPIDLKDKEVVLNEVPDNGKEIYAQDGEVGEIPFNDPPESSIPTIDGVNVTINADGEIAQDVNGATVVKPVSKPRATRGSRNKKE